MKEYFKNFTLKKLCSLVLGAAFVIIMLVTAVGSRHRVISALREADGKSIVEVKDDIDSTYNSGVYRKYDYINLAGLSAGLLKMQEFNTALKLENGQLCEKPGDADYNDECAVKLKELNGVLQEKGIDLLYLHIPSKGGETTGLLPKGISDNGDFLYDSHAASLEEFGISVLNMKEVFNAEGLKQEDVFYTTDHHWRVSTAFLAYQKAAEFFNENYGANIDEKYVDINNFNTETYEDIFLGSYGRRTGRYYAGIDDFELITPKENIDSQITFEIASKNESSAGNFRECLVKEEHLEYGEYFELNPYAAYLGGNYARAKITNENAPCDKKLLVLTDSMGYPLMSFMSLAFSEIEYVDLRYYRDMAFIDVVEESKPDNVVFIYSMTRLFDGVSFEFFEKITEDAVME